jgi:hypothetical protein
MPLPELTHVGQRLYDAIRPWAEPYDEANDYTAAQFCAVDPLAEVIRDQDDGTPGWAIIWDPDLCPVLFLPFLGRLVGIDFRGTGYTEAQMRTAIRERPGFKRGTPDAIKSAARRHLTGTQYVALIEKNGGPGHFTVVVRTSESPDLWAIRQAVLEQKPAGLTFDIVQSDAPTVDEGTLTIDAVPETIDAAVVGDIT